MCVWQFFSRLMLTWRHFDCREIFEAALAACCSLSFCARVCVCYQFTCCRCYRVVSRSRMLSCCCGSVTFPPWLVFFAYKATQGCCLFRWWCVGGNFACHAFWGRRLQLESAGKEMGISKYKTGCLLHFTAVTAAASFPFPLCRVHIVHSWVAGKNSNSWQSALCS